MTFKSKAYSETPSSRALAHTYRKPRLLQHIQRMQPREGTHRWRRSSQTAGRRTCHPERHRHTFSIQTQHTPASPSALSYFSDHGESQQVTDDADHSDEDFSPVSLP